MLSNCYNPLTAEQLEEYEHQGGQLFPYREYISLLNFEKQQVTDMQPNALVLETVPTQQFLEEQDAPYLLNPVTMQVGINTESERLEYIQTSLIKPFRVNPFVRIRGFDQRLDFEYILEVGEVVLTQMQMDADVKFVVVRRQFELGARLYDFSCPPVLQPASCPELQPIEESEPSIDDS